MSGKAKKGDIEFLATFSGEIDSWHNEAHMALRDATGTPMMDPVQNIFYLPSMRASVSSSATMMDERRGPPGLALEASPPQLCRASSGGRYECGCR